MDDVLAIDYGFAARKVEIGSRYRERLNKDLAHLTYSRGERELEEKYWPINQIVPPILIRSREFIKHLLSDYLLANSAEAIPYWEHLLKKISRWCQELPPDTAKDS